MSKKDKQIKRIGASSLVLGILTIIFGITIGTLSIVNGGKLLARKK
jgi:hypothetical protein